MLDPNFRSLVPWLFPLLALATGCIDSSAPDQPEGADGGPEPLTLSIDTQADVRGISPLIYGVNPHAGYRCDDPSLRLGACRLGGNRWTAYNWESNLSNAGRDWCFQNDYHLVSAAPCPPESTEEDAEPRAPEDAPPGWAATCLIEQADAVGAATMLTVPIVDHVAGVDTGGSDPPECSGDVRRVDDYLQSRFVQNAPRKNAPLSSTPDLLDGFVYQDEFVALVRERAQGARVIFSLDNEPDLWDETHPEVHPEPVSYSELVERTVSFASAIRDTWPEAEIAGLAGAGYPSLMNLWGAPDSEEHGRFVDYFLAALQHAESASGVRLLDYLDVHWYPEIRAEGEDGDEERLTSSEASEALIEARVQAPRSLWDPTYHEQSWLTDAYGHQPLRLIPWVQEKLDALYPQARLAITEWYYGGGDHISGGIAAADVLGIFGREGVGLATLWPHSNDEGYVRAAFRIYRNFDGEGASFGDWSVRARSNDDAVAAVYASLDSADPERVIVVAINRTADEQTARLALSHPEELGQAEVFTLTGESSEIQRAGSLAAVEPNQFDYPMPGYSVSVLVLAP